MNFLPPLPIDSLIYNSSPLLSYLAFFFHSSTFRNRSVVFLLFSPTCCVGTQAICQFCFRYVLNLSKFLFTNIMQNPSFCKSLLDSGSRTNKSKQIINQSVCQWVSRLTFRGGKGFSSDCSVEASELVIFLVATSNSVMIESFQQRLNGST